LGLTRRVGAVALGAAVVILINGAFSLIFFPQKLGPYFTVGPYWTYTNDSTILLALTSLPRSAHLLGGLVSGGLDRSSPGLSGSLSAVLSALVAVGRFLYAYPSGFGPSVDAITRAKNAEFLLFLGGLFSVYFPFTVLAGYLGGRIGGRLRTATRS
jgi:hypothetical protein